MSDEVKSSASTSDEQSQGSPSRRDLIVGATVGTAVAASLATQASAQAPIVEATAIPEPKKTGLLVWVKNDLYYIDQQQLESFKVLKDITNEDKQKLKRRLRRVGHGVGVRKAMFGKLGVVEHPAGDTANFTPAPTGKTYASAMFTGDQILEVEDALGEDEPS